MCGEVWCLVVWFKAVGYGKLQYYLLGGVEVWRLQCGMTERKLV